jgi:hypothetical protein
MNSVSHESTGYASWGPCTLVSFPLTNQFIECVKRLTLIRNDSLHKFYVKLVWQHVVLSEITEMSDEIIGKQNEFSRISVDWYW